ncbi:MAG TPA: glycosyltransferase family 4 protein [Candidatus Binataceae bacterium]|nr:glycosyltransferase family 4 protein [Candidatus Binataceae bacterium]
MRIALITRRFDPAGGGTERDLMVTAQYLRDAGYEVVIYADEVRAETSSWTVHNVPNRVPGRALRIWRFAQTAPAQARREGADLVVSFARTIGADVMRSGGGAHVSYVRAAARWRGLITGGAMWLSTYHRAQMAVERSAFRSPLLKQTVAVSNLVRDDLVREFALDPKRAITIYNGVDPKRFQPAPDDDARAAIRRRMGITGPGPMVVFAGNGFARKGLEFLLRAWPTLDRDAWLVVAGEDRAMLKFRHLSHRLGVGGRVIFAGRRRDLSEIFSAADVFALPSLFEPFGNVVMEAMASGLPPLTSAAAGVSELLPETMRHFVVNDPANPEEISAKLGELIARRAEFREPVRAAAERCTWDEYGRRFIELIESLR